MARKKVGGTTNKVMNRGAWTEEEDRKLADYVRTHGDRKWRSLPAKAGLNRCGKSCRLRWLNYLRPGIKRGNITEEEEDLIIRLHNLLGNRWSLIAGRLPGRTDNEIKNHWNTHLSKKAITINELNFKLNQKLKNVDQDSNEPAIPVKSITDCSETLRFPGKFTSNSAGFDDWLNEELEFDFNGFFDFSSTSPMPDSDPLISTNFTAPIDNHFTNEDSFHDICDNQFDVEMREITEKQSPFHQSPHNNMINNVHALNWLFDVEDHVSLHLSEGFLL